MRGKEIYFAGAGDVEGGAQGAAGGAPLAWAIEYPGRPAYEAQNEATLDGIAAILHEFEAVMLEVRANPNPNPNPSPSPSPNPYPSPSPSPNPNPNPHPNPNPNPNQELIRLHTAAAQPELAARVKQIYRLSLTQREILGTGMLPLLAAESASG